MRVCTDGNGSTVWVRFKRRPRASCQDWLPHAPSGSWVEAEVVVPVRGHLPQRMKQLHRDAPGAVLPVAGPQRGQRPCAVEVAGKASFSGPPPLPAEVQGHSAAARGLQVHFSAPRHSLWHHLVSGRGSGAGVPIPRECDEPGVPGGLVLAAFITAPGTSCAPSRRSASQWVSVTALASAVVKRHDGTSGSGEV